MEGVLFVWTFVGVHVMFWGCIKKITMNPYSETTFLGPGLCVTFFVLAEVM